MGLCSLGMIVAAFLLTWLYLVPRARYYAVAPEFFLTARFLKEHLAQPGGLIEYAGAFLAQLEYISWVGALTWIVLLAALSWLCRQILNKQVDPAGVLWLVPGLVLWGASSRYLPDLYSLTLKLTVALASATFWLDGAGPDESGSTSGFGTRSMSKPGKLLLPRFIALSVAVTLLIYGAGIACALTFVSLVACRALRTREQNSLLLTDGSAAVLVWVLALLIWSNSDWHAHRISGAALGLNMFVYGFVPLVLIIQAAWQSWDRKIRFSPPQLAATRTVFAFAALAGLLWNFDSNRRLALCLHAAALDERWEEVTNYASGLKHLDPAVAVEVRLALFHQGKLNDALFSFPADGSDILPSLSNGLEVCLPLSDTLIELGHGNLAERYAQEWMEIRGERPETLWRLAWINLVKQRPRAAAVFLRRLRQVPFYSRQADEWLSRLAKDPALASDLKMAKARACMVAQDDVELRFSTESLLRAVIRPDCPNRMAVEYLMAHFLVTHQPQQVAPNLPLFERAGARELPRHLAEAVLVSAEGRATNLSGWQINPEIVRQFDAFREMLRRESTARPPRSDAARAFRDTFWFYDLSGGNRPARQGRT